MGKLVCFCSGYYLYITWIQMFHHYCFVTFYLAHIVITFVVHSYVLSNVHHIAVITIGP